MQRFDENRTAKTAGKQKYVTPKLVRHGDVRRLTQGAGAGTRDSGAPKTRSTGGPA